jgi:hypothetical protein
MKSWKLCSIRLNEWVAILKGIYNPLCDTSQIRTLFRNKNCMNLWLISDSGPSSLSRFGTRLHFGWFSQSGFHRERQFILQYGWSTSDWSRQLCPIFCPSPCLPTKIWCPTHSCVWSLNSQSISMYSRLIRMVANSEGRSSLFCQFVSQRHFVVHLWRLSSKSNVFFQSVIAGFVGRLRGCQVTLSKSINNHVLAINPSSRLRPARIICFHVSDPPRIVWTCQVRPLEADHVDRQDPPPRMWILREDQVHCPEKRIAHN